MIVNGVNFRPISEDPKFGITMEEIQEQRSKGALIDLTQKVSGVPYAYIINLMNLERINHEY